jgi:hypothetical protein
MGAPNLITPTGDVRTADPTLWFCSTSQAWDQQQTVISDLQSVLTDVPVLLSARFHDEAIRERIGWLGSHGRAFAVEPFGEASEGDPLNPPAWLQRERAWLVPPIPSPGNYAPWMVASLRHQDSLAPALLITPSPSLPLSGGARLVEELADAAHAAASQVASQLSCLIGFSGSREWLRSDQALQSLGNVLVDSRLAGVYLRISHRESVVRDREYLRGLRELTTGLSDAGFLVFLPNSGRLGWLSFGWGAWSISAGITLGSWSERERTPMNQPAQPSQWYYEHQLGMEVRWRHHQELARLRAYDWCSCAHCALMQNGYDPVLARRHALEQLAQDVQQLRNAKGVPERARRIRERLMMMKSFSDIVSRRLGTSWEGYELDFIDRWLETV